MRILYDGFIYDFQQHGGINRYFNEIISRLPPDATPKVSSFLGRRDFWPSHPRLQVVRSRPFASIPSLAFLGHGWLDLRTRLERADLLHPTYYHWLTPSLLRSRRPVIATVHDMIHELFPHELDSRRILAADKRKLIERADLILCNSECTRRDLVHFFPAVASRTRVTLLASSLELDVQLDATTAPLARPFFLFVGGRERYKNFNTLLDAWQRFSSRCPDVQLRVVGSPWLPAEKARMADSGASDSITHEGKVGDARLSVLYRRSLALVYPSRYEGFGIPVVEAMRCGTAAIVARSSSLPEVGGDAAQYFDPQSAEDLAALLERMATSPALRAECVARGAVRHREFSWDQTARLTFQAYAQLVA